MENKNIEKHIENLFKNDSNNYIFIYTPPKVGSTTLVTSLRISLGKSYNIIHIHDETMLNVLTGIKNVTINEIINYLNEKGKNVYVIDVYRLPIERKMSEFFEKIDCYHFNNTCENINKYNINRIYKRFNNLFTHLSNGDHYFDKYNIENPIPFDFENKYTLQIINNIKYIKLRLCDSSIWGKILSNIFKTDIVLINDYSTDSKDINILYKKFKSEYKLPLNYLEIIKNCKYFHFYNSENEKNEYIKKWSLIVVDDYVGYSKEEYNFYVNLYLENQYINDIQKRHYIDNNCYCINCSKKRCELFFKAKSGENIKEKIEHETAKNNLNKKKQNKKIIINKPKNFNLNLT